MQNGALTSFLSVGGCVAIKKVRYCHAEQSEASCVFKVLQRRDSSAAPQNDIATQSLEREDVNSIKQKLPSQSPLNHNKDAIITASALWKIDLFAKIDSSYT